MAVNEAPPKSGSNPEQLADYSFYAGIASIVLSLSSCIPIVNLCTCFLAPMAGIAAIVMGAMARNNLGSEASGQAADRARYGLFMGIGSIVLVLIVQTIFFAIGFSSGILDFMQSF